VTLVISESTVEDAAFSYFRDLGYVVVHGEDIAPDTAGTERVSYSEVVLTGRLLAALCRINPALPATAVDKVMRRIMRPDNPSVVESNRRFHRSLIDGVDIEYHADDGRIVHDKVWPIDFANPDNNDWVAVNQFTVIENKHNRRPDIVVFVNGLPLGVIELKDATDEQATIRRAFNQIQTYKREIPSLFAFNEALVISDRLEARIGTLTSDAGDDRHRLLQYSGPQCLSPLTPDCQDRRREQE